MRTSSLGTWTKRGLSALAGLTLLASCDPSSVVQIGETDVVLLRVFPDSAGVPIGRTLGLRFLPLDTTRSLVVGLTAQWESRDPSVATVDENGVVTGVATGTAEIVATVSGVTGSARIDVAPAPAIVLSGDSVGFVAAAGGPVPGPDSVEVTNGGFFPLVGLAVDSITYTGAATGWLSAGLESATAPATLTLTPATGPVTAAGTYSARVWVSGSLANNSPTSVRAVLRVTGGAPATAAVSAGDGQTAVAGSAVATPPAALVSDAFGNPVQDVTVTFAVTGGGGSLTGATATTDANGVATVGSWTLGTTAGPNAVSATVSGLTPVAFTATGTAGVATQLVVAGGNNQSAVAGSAVSVAPAVRATDQFGNAVAGVSITFEIANGGGTLTGPNSVTAPNGETSVGSWTLGPTAGANTLRAISPTVADTATFSATGVSGAAAAMYLEAGDAQTDTVAATLPIAYSVRVVDSNGNGVADVPVSWSVTGGGGSIPASTMTDANGYATAVRVLGTTAGTQTAQGAVGGLAGSPVPFTATATPGAPASIAAFAGAGQSATVNTFVSTPPQVVVRDRFANPIPGHSVTFAVTAGGGAVAPTTPVTTAANGTATASSWRLGTAAGTNNNEVTATAAGIGLSGNPVAITASATAGAAASIAVSAGDSQTANTGTAVATAPVVIVRDQFDNAVPGVTVTFTPSGSGTVGSGSVVTNESGTASTSWTLDVGGHTVATNGTFANTLTASASGFNTAFTGFARYSWATNVSILFGGCTGCHGGATPFSGLALDGTAAANYSALVDVAPVCDTPGTLAAAGYRRVATGGGVSAAETFSVILRLLDPTLVGPPVNVDCVHPFTTGNLTFLATLNAWIRNGAPNN